MKQQSTSVVPSLALEEIKQYLDRIDKDVREVKKQYRDIQNALDSIYQDRDLITDVINDVDKIRGLVIAADKHNEELSKNVEYTVEKKTEQVKAEVHVTTHDVKNTIVQKVVHGITKNFKQEEKNLIKKPWYKRLLFWVKTPTVNVAV